MKNFRHYVKFRDLALEQQAQAAQPVQNQVLDNAKNSLMASFNQEFQRDPQGSLTWLNNLYTKVLPAEYQSIYGKWKQNNQAQQPQPQQQQQQQQQPQQPQQPPQQKA